MRRSRQSGFTLVEILVAMGLLVIGMTGIISLFSAALDLETEASERMEASLLLPEALERVGDEAAARANATAGARGRNRGDGEFVIGTTGRWRCRYLFESVPGDDVGREVLARVTLTVPSPGGDRRYDFGYIPIILPSDNVVILRGQPRKNP